MRGAIEILPEETLRGVVDSLVRLVEAAGAAVIFIGALIGVVKFLAALPKRNPEEFVPVRLSLGRYLALGLEFQLASDVLRTAIAPSFQELGKLAAVAAIRTALNFFLAREIAEERRIVDARGEADDSAGADGHRGVGTDADAPDVRPHGDGVRVDVRGFERGSGGASPVDAASDE
jgi:uncharacterized membrane protein